MSTVVVATAPAPAGRPAGVADVCAVVPNVIANQRASLSQLHLLLLHRRVLARDSGTSHLDFAGLSVVLWAICEAFGRRKESGVLAAANTAVLEVSSAAVILAELYGPGSHASLVPTPPDVDCAVKVSKAAVVFSAPPATPAGKKTTAGDPPLPARGAVAFVRAAWALLAAVSPAGAAPVLRHVKEVCWAAAAKLPVACSVELIKATEAAVGAIVADTGISNRHEVAAEMLAAFPGDARFDARCFATQHTPTSAARPVATPFVAPAPAALDGLSWLLNVQAAAVAAVRKQAGPAGTPHLDAVLREAVDAARKKSGTFGAGHLGLVVGLGDRAFLAALLARRLAAAPADVDATDAPTFVRLPFAQTPTDSEIRGVIDAPSATATVLVAAALAAAVPASTGSTSPESTSPLAPLLADVAGTDAGAARLVEIHFDHVLRVTGTEGAAREAAAAATGPQRPVGPKLRRALQRVVSELVTLSRPAQDTWVRRAVAAADWAVERSREALRSGSRHMRAIGAHGYELQRAIRDTAQSLAEASREALQGTTAPIAAPMSAEAALALLKALAALQPVCLMHRAAQPKSTDTKKVAAEDWRVLRVAGYFLVELLASGSPRGAEAPATAPTADNNGTGPRAPKTPVAQLLRHVRTLTRTQGMDRDVFLSEPLYFLTTVLNNKAAVKAVSDRDMLKHWVPSALRCVLAAHSPALRRSGHVLLAVPLVEKHSAALRVFPTYVNVFVSSPRTRQHSNAARDDAAVDGGVSYGPVPDDSLKLFSRYFRHIAGTIETIDAPAAAVAAAPASSAADADSNASASETPVDGPHLLKWAVRQLAGVAGYYLALRAPSRDELQRRRLYFCTLIDCVQLGNPIALDAACAAIEALLLSMTNAAEANVFLDYASGAVQASSSVATKKSVAEWLLGLREKLAAQHAKSGMMRSKL